MSFIHGDSPDVGRTSLHVLWVAMRARCRMKPTNPRYESYKHVRCCPEWEDYVTFKNWALAHGYAKGLILDRKDNALGYNRENCRFVTMSVSNKNKRWTAACQRHIHELRKAKWRPIFCVEARRQFLNLKEAAAWCNGDSSLIHRAARTGFAHRQMHWRFTA